MAVIRRCPELAYFLPTAEFSDAGSRVLFTRFSGNDELLTKTVGFDEQGVKMPESTYAKLQEALAKFKSMAGDSGLTPDEARFVAEFRLPDRHQFPGAYRILKTKWYSCDRLFVLWGLESGNSGGIPVIKILAGAGNAPSTRPTLKGGEGVDPKPKTKGVMPLAVPASSATPPGGISDEHGSRPNRESTSAGSSTSGNGSSVVGSGGSGEFGVGGGPVFAKRGRSCWRGCLWLLFLLFLLLVLLFLLSTCAPTYCTDHTSRLAENYLPQEVIPNTPSSESLPKSNTPVPAPPPSDVQKFAPKQTEPPKWWKSELGKEKIHPRDIITPLPGHEPAAPGKFEVYIRQETTLTQRPPTAEIHLGLRYHGQGAIKEITWILDDGAKKEGEFLDEAVPFSAKLSASTEIDVTFTYVDEAGVEHQKDGFTFRYELNGRISFEEEFKDSDEKRTPSEKDAERKMETAKKAKEKGA